MIILPAIDLKDGKAVRLYQGDFDTVHQVADDPLATARDFQRAGAVYIQVVDLDGAKEGVRRNSDIVRRLAESGLKIELGGGIRTMEDLKAVFAMGIHRTVIGSAAVSNPELVRQAVERYGSERIAVGIDTQDGKVRTAGWVENSGLDYLEFAKQMEAIGVKLIVFTDIETDGALCGPSYERLEELQKSVACRIIASGGVSCQEDLSRLNAMGVYGAIVGKAYYAGAVDLAAAIREGGPQC